MGEILVGPGEGGAGPWPFVLHHDNEPFTTQVDSSYVRTVLYRGSYLVCLGEPSPFFSIVRPILRGGAVQNVTNCAVPAVLNPSTATMVRLYQHSPYSIVTQKPNVSPLPTANPRTTRGSAAQNSSGTVPSTTRLLVSR